MKKYLVIIDTGLCGGMKWEYKFFHAENDEQAKEEAFRIKEEIRKLWSSADLKGKTKTDALYQVREIDFTK